jgi:hypothetical protein
MLIGKMLDSPYRFIDLASLQLSNSFFNDWLIFKLNFESNDLPLMQISWF